MWMNDWVNLNNSGKIQALVIDQLSSRLVDWIWLFFSESVVLFAIVSPLTLRRSKNALFITSDSEMELKLHTLRTIVYKSVISHWLSRNIGVHSYSRLPFLLLTESLCVSSQRDAQPFPGCRLWQEYSEGLVYNVNTTTADIDSISEMSPLGFSDVYAGEWWCLLSGMETINQ